MNHASLSHAEIMDAVVKMASAIQRKAEADPAGYATQRMPRVFPIPRGGVPVAYLLVGVMPIEIVDSPEMADFIVDDIVDSGATANRIMLALDKPIPLWALFRRPTIYPPKLDPRFSGFVDAVNITDSWVVFPWEDQSASGADDIVIRLLQFIGEDPNREGLRETPARVIKAWKEWTSGYSEDPASVMKTFEDGAAKVDEMIIIRDIPFWSHCEHHLAPFFGVAHIGYVPKGRIVGLSKLARLVDIFARRLQVQERLTNQIADALIEGLAPLGAGVVIEARHMCMESRGVKRTGSLTVTSAMRGAMLTKPEARAEFFAIVNRKEGWS